MAAFGRTIAFAMEDAFASLARFPLWWYTQGCLRTAQLLFSLVKNQATSLAIGVWVRNIFTPMYGRSDWQSRLISVVVRLGQIVARGAFLFILTLLCLGLFALYLVLPLVAVAGAIFHLFGALM